MRSLPSLARCGQGVGQPQPTTLTAELLDLHCQAIAAGWNRHHYSVWASVLERHGRDSILIPCLRAWGRRVG
jgi:hypothetical protein